MNDSLLNIFSGVESYHWWFVGRRLLLERTLKKYLKEDKNIQILDIGCGTGGSLDFLSQFGKVYGVDNSKLAVRYCKQNKHANVKLSDAVSLPYKDNKFDIVTMLDVLEHIKNDQVALKEAKRVVKTNGLIITTSPALPFMWSRHDSMQGHYRRYLKSDFYNLAKKAKLSIITLSYFNTLLLPPIAGIRKLSNTRFFKHLGEYDSKINFDLAKIKALNTFLFLIFKTEVFLGRWISYPSGVSLLCVFKK